MRINGFCVTVVMMIVFTAAASVICGCREKMTGEIEPNDSFANAALLHPEKPVEGRLSTRDDQDFYRLEIHDPVVLDIRLSPVKGVNHAMKIWKGEETPVLIKMIDDMRKSSPEKMCNLYAEPGIYFINVLHGERDLPRGNAESSYMLQVSGRTAESEEMEPNDSLRDANPVGAGTILRGYFSPAYNRINPQTENPLREEDWYSLPVTLDAGKPVLLDIHLGSVPGVNSVLYLYSDTQELIGSADVNGAGDGEILSDIGISAPGNYYIMVTSGNFESNCDTPYELNVVLRDYDATAEMESNNDAGRANPLGDHEMSARIYPGGDRDFFLYRNASGPAMYRIEIISPEGLDMTVSLLNREGLKIAESDNGSSGDREVIPNAYMDGDFYVVTGARSGSFDKENSYRLKVNRFAQERNFEIEPNDRMERATKITRDSVQGYTSKKKDVDWFVLEDRRRTRKTFSLKGVKDARLRLSIADPFGYIIKSEEVDGDRTVSIREMIDLKGYVKIEALQENYDEPYRLYIREEK